MHLFTIMDNEDADMDWMITAFNTAVTETASEILGKRCHEKKPLGPAETSMKGTEKEKIQTQRIWEVHGSEQHQEVHKKGKRKTIRRTV